MPTPAFKVGDLVAVRSRTWPGVNKPGGTGRITALVEGGAKANVKYLLGGSERAVPLEFVSSSDVMGGARRTPVPRRNRDDEILPSPPRARAAKDAEATKMVSPRRSTSLGKPSTPRAASAASAPQPKRHASAAASRGGLTAAENAAPRAPKRARVAAMPTATAAAATQHAALAPSSAAVPPTLPWGGSAAQSSRDDGDSSGGGGGSSNAATFATPAQAARLEPLQSPLDILAETALSSANGLGGGASGVMGEAEEALAKRLHFRRMAANQQQQQQVSGAAAGCYPVIALRKALFEQRLSAWTDAYRRCRMSRVPAESLFQAVCSPALPRLSLIYKPY